MDLPVTCTLPGDERPAPDPRDDSAWELVALLLIGVLCVASVVLFLWALRLGFDALEAARVMGMRS